MIHVITIDVGDVVLCDICGEDWSNRQETGGIYGFMTKAICPDCAPRIEESAKRYGEEQYLLERCPLNKSFAQWVREDLRVR
jgi:hypothetical protein